jgi:hypothetical protein
MLHLTLLNIVRAGEGVGIVDTITLTLSLKSGLSELLELRATHDAT